MKMKRKTILNPVLILSLMMALTTTLVSTSTVLADGEGSWVTRTSMPTPRTGLSVVAANNGKIYAIGGWDGVRAIVLDTVEEYDPATDTWTSRASMPTAREGLRAVMAGNGKIYAIGGGNNVIVGTVEEYDPTTDTWTSRTSMPTPRTSPDVTVASNGNIYVIGGWANGIALDTVEEYNPSTDSWTVRTDMPTARGSLGTVTLGDKIYAIGGSNTGNDSSLAIVEVYDPVDDTWTTRASMPTARQSFGAVAASNGRIYVIGGWKYWSDYVATVEEYDPVTDTWAIRASMPTARYMLDAAEASNGKIYAIGGRIYMASSEVDANEEFTPPFLPMFAATTDNQEIYPGDPVAVDLGIQNAVDLYAAQALCEVDPAVLEIQSAEFGDFFDPVLRVALIDQVDAVNGEWLGAISQQNPADPLSGDGLYATLEYVAQAPGTSNVSCEPIFSDRDGFTLPVTYSGTEITVLPFATLEGVVLYQGRTGHAGIEVTASGEVTQSDETDAAGTFVLDELRSGDYEVEASAALYLPACAHEVTVTSGETVTLDAVTLLGGDLTGNEVIDIGDLSLLGAGFGTPATGADINADGIVNVQDLAILAGNYETSGCREW
jgi:N-acetylneuraminic acid mutarotase